MKENYQLDHVVIQGKQTTEIMEILTPEALEFVVSLQRKFGNTRKELLAKRSERQKKNR